MMQPLAGSILENRDEEAMLKKDDAEHPVPEELRSRFRQIVEAFVAGDFELSNHSIEGVTPISPETAKIIAENVDDYGDELAPLSDETWDRSVYQWMDGYWQVMVDLSTASETVSDLVLHAKLYEDDGLRLEVYLVYVP